jgi:hypothetical protein
MSDLGGARGRLLRDTRSKAVLKPRAAFAAAVVLMIPFLGACATVHTAHGESGTYVGVVRVVSEAPAAVQATQEASGVLGVWRVADADGSPHIGLGWRSAHRLIFNRDCRVVFNVATDAQLAEAERFVASTAKGENLCAAIKR